MKSFLEDVAELEHLYLQKQTACKVFRKHLLANSTKTFTNALTQVMQIFSVLKQLEKINRKITSLNFDHPPRISQAFKKLTERVSMQTLAISKLLNCFEPEGNDVNSEMGFDSFYHAIRQLTLNIDRDLSQYKKFIKDLKARYQQKLAVSVIGFGEISTVLAFTGGGTFAQPEPKRNQWVYKKMPVFSDIKQAKRYAEIYREYFRIITKNIGIIIPEQKIQIHPLSECKIRIYSIQKKIPVETVGHRLLQRFSEDECALFMRMILGEIKKVAHFNRSQPEIKLAIDAQISNWALPEFNPEQDQLNGNEKLVFIDTSSPLYRVNGIEQLDAEIFLKSTPFFLRPIIRALFLQDVLDRYYDTKLDTIDLVANFYKEGRAEYIPRMISVTNDFFSTEMADFRIQPLTMQEVTKYYKEDAFIWKFYLAARKIDRFITEKLLRKNYEFRLPDHVKR